MLDPKELHVVLTQTNTVTVVTAAYAIVIDKKTGKVIKKIPENPVRGNKLPGGPTPPLLAALAAGVSALEATEGLKGLEDMQAQAAKMVMTAVEGLAKHASLEIG